MRYVVGFSIGYALAVASTVFRLLHRHRRQQLWWDDMWAAVALFAALYIFTSYEVVNWCLELQTLSVRVRSFLAWSQFWAHTTAIWTSRVSMQTTVVHFLPPGQNRTISQWATGVFILGWIVAGIVKMFYNGIPIPLVPQPPWGKIPTFIDLTMGVLATLWLVLWPAYLLTRMKLNRRVKRLVSLSFGTALLFLGLEIFHCVNILHGGDRTVLRVSGAVELTSAIVVANMVVLITAIYQRFYPDADHRHDTKSSKEEEPTSGDITATKMTEFTSVEEPLTELHSSDIEWSESQSESQQRSSSSWPTDSSNSRTNQTRSTRP